MTAQQHPDSVEKTLNPYSFFTKLISNHLHAYQPYYNTEKSAIYMVKKIGIIK
ncbi:hypothetical protein AGMMS49587_15850 [Spirochaetia bacterium]|nr:hypothetical protein AGMMS49587_15850 [Spirochaetia bacterium]